MLMLMMAATLLPSQSDSYDLAWDLRLEDEYNLGTYNVVSIYHNGVLVAIEDVHYRGHSNVYEVNGDVATIQGFYYVYSRPYNSRDRYEVVPGYRPSSHYYQDSTGDMTNLDQGHFPSSRDMPVFPSESVSIGDTWSAAASVVDNLSSIGGPNWVEIPVVAHYTVTGESSCRSARCLVIRIEYEVNHDVSSGDQAIAIHGVFSGDYYWNVSEGFNPYFEATYRYTYTLPDGQTVVYEGDSYGEANRERPQTSEDEPPAESEPQRPTRDEIREELTERLTGDASGATVEEREDGIGINFGSVLFEINRPDIRDEFLPSLDNLAAYLQRNPGLSIRIEGHTDNSGHRSLSLRLSRQRAEGVMNYLITKGVDPSQLEAQGYGPDRPRVSNDTWDGRQQNRRVEVVILDVPHTVVEPESDSDEALGDSEPEQPRSEFEEEDDFLFSQMLPDGE